MDGEWALVEYRRGRYVKVTPDGTVLGRATDDEIRAWFASHGWRFGRPHAPELTQIPPTSEEPLAEGRAAAGARDEEGSSPLLSELGQGPVQQPALPAFDRDGAHTATAEQGKAPRQEPTPLEAVRASEEPQATPPVLEHQVTEPEAELPAKGLAAVLESQVGAQATARRPVTVDSQPATAQVPEREALEVEPVSHTPDAGPQGATISGAGESSAQEKGASGGEEASVPSAENPIDEKTAGVTSVSGAKPAIVALSAVEQVGVPVEPALLEADSTDRWLWVDPRQEQGYSSAGFDMAAFLDRAIDLFRSKPWTGDKEPRRLAVHPSAIAEPLETAAEERNLELVADPKVAAGTYRLALAEREKVKIQNP